jgi:hypothetical protein
MNYFVFTTVILTYFLRTKSISLLKLTRVSIVWHIDNKYFLITNKNQRCFSFFKLKVNQDSSVKIININIQRVLEISILILTGNGTS